MAATTQELQQLSADLATEHGAPLVKIACLWHVCLTTYHDLSPDQAEVMAPVHDFHREVIHEYAAARGLSGDDVIGAIRDLRRAGATAGYLAALPE